MFFIFSLNLIWEFSLYIYRRYSCLRIKHFSTTKKYRSIINKVCVKVLPFRETSLIHIHILAKKKKTHSYECNALFCSNTRKTRIRKKKKRKVWLKLRSIFCLGEKLYINVDCFEKMGNNACVRSGRGLFYSSAVGNMERGDVYIFPGGRRRRLNNASFLGLSRNNRSLAIVTGSPFSPRATW